MKSPSRKNKKDYLKNKPASIELAKRLQDFYHKKGYSFIKVWVEDFPSETPETPEYYSIRSNIKFNVANIETTVLK